MTATQIKRENLLTAVGSHDPSLVEHFSRVLPANKDQYSVEELNTVLRYDVMQLPVDTIHAREYLCSTTSAAIWLSTFCKQVLPCYRQARGGAA
ncbi:MAG: hypothetical protein [Bacteriophage sp.]|nr:MAG: hypothetical protein [Bacteriophage sp.]